MIAESLAGKRIAITGSTGFVGTALVERMLRSVPDCELVLLVRDGKRTPAAKRTQKEILKNNAFDRLREKFGAPDSSETFAEMTDRRITTIAGDVSRDGLDLNDTDRATFASCNTIIHSAAAVSKSSQATGRLSLARTGTTSAGTTAVTISSYASRTRDANRMKLDSTAWWSSLSCVSLLALAPSRMLPSTVACAMCFACMARADAGVDASSERRSPAVRDTRFVRRCRSLDGRRTSTEPIRSL